MSDRFALSKRDRGRLAWHGLLVVGLLALGVGSAAAQTPIDRLALHGAIACTWMLSDAPNRYEVFEAVRQTLASVGSHVAGDTVPQAEQEAVMKRFNDLKLNSFEKSQVDSCLQREGERVRSLISPPK